MTVREMIDRADLNAVWHALGGGNLRRGRGIAFWRRGANGRNVSIDRERGVWNDFATGQGGGILDLIETARGGSRADALRWLADHLGVDLSGGPEQSPEDRRRLAREDARRADLARARPWKRGRIAGLERLKVQAVKDHDLEALEATAHELWALQRADGAALVDLWRAALRTDPNCTDACERWAEEDVAFAAALTGIAVALIADKESREPRYRPSQHDQPEA